MPNEIGWPYNYVGVSDPITSTAVLAGLTAASARLDGTSRSGSNLTVAGQTVALNELTDNCRYITGSNTALLINLAGGASLAVPETRGRERGSIQGEFYLDYAANKSCEVLRFNRGGIRVVYVERPSPSPDEYLVGVVSINEVSDEAPDESGLSYFSVTFTNSSHGEAPGWKAY